mgnify:CR=1 FL=1
MSAVISSTFKIVTDLAAGQGTTNIGSGQAGVNRTWRVVSVQGSGLDTATITVSKVDINGVNTEVILTCIAGDPQALTETVT